MASRKSKPSTPASLWALSLASVGVGIGIHILAVRKGPFHELEVYKLLTPVQLRQHLGFKDTAAWSAKEVFGAHSQLKGWAKAYDGFVNFGMILMVFFKNFMQHNLGKGLTLGLLSTMLPLASFMVNEALKPHRNAFLSILGVVDIMLIGQAICIGAATPLFFVPLYIRRRVAEHRKNPAGIHPLPAPHKAALAASTVLSMLTVGTALATTFVPTTSPHWVTANLAFQLFPLIFAPLALWPVVRSVLGIKEDAHRSSRPDGKVVVRANKSLVDLYAMTSWLALALQGVSVALSWPHIGGLLRGAFAALRALPSSLAGGHAIATLHALAKKEARLHTDGEWLLLFDHLGLLLSGYLLILADQLIDEWVLRTPLDAQASTAGGKVKAARTKQRVHAQRSVIEDALMGLPIALVCPGFALSRYFQRRELMAEKARFEQVAGKVQ